MYGKSLPTRESVGGGQRSEMDKKAALPLLSLHALSEMDKKAALLLLSLHALGILHLVYLIFIRNSYTSAMTGFESCVFGLLCHSVSL